MSLHCLPQSTVKLIGSSQVITSVSATVKELVENSLDAGAHSIDVKLENHGLDKIEVRDDGCGINKNDVHFMCKKSYTSKISSFSDLDELRSYGFRGEALNALCTVSKVSVTTIAVEDTLAYTYLFDNNGNVKESKPSHVNKGTIIIAEGLFKNLPVRRQYLANGRRKSQEMKNVESVVKSLAVIHPRLRLTLTHNKFLIWQKNGVANLKQSLAQAIPPTIVFQLDSFHFEDLSSNIEMDVVLPRKDCNVSVTCFSNRDDAYYIFINSRPIKNKNIEKTVESELFQYFGHYIPSNKYPMCLLSLKIPPDELDVNLEPNKTKVIIKESDYLIDKIKSQFVKYYTGVEEDVDATTPVDIKLPKRKLESDEIHENYMQDNTKIPRVENSSSENGGLNEAHIDTGSNCEMSLPVSNNNSSQNNLTSETFSEVENSVNSQDIFNEDNHEDLNVTKFNKISHNIDKSQEDIRDKNNESVSTDKISWGDDNFTSQELDELEIILARSTQSSIIVEPDINSSIDFNTSEEMSSQNSCNDKMREEFRNDNICEFLSGLPIKSTASSLNSNDGSIKNRVDSSDKNMKNTDVNAVDSINSNAIDSVVSKVVDSVKIVNSSLNIIELEKLKKQETSLDEVTLSQWSRGHVAPSINAPVIVQSYNQSILDDPDRMDSQEPVDETDFDLESTNSAVSQTNRSVSSQMGCKSMSAFTKFAREMRSKIVQKSPGISFTRVASELVVKWRELTNDERNGYGELARQDRTKERVERNSSPDIKMKQSTIKLKAPSETSKILKKVRYDKVVEIDVSISGLRNRLETSSRSCTETNFSHIINKLDEDLYLYSVDNCLSVLSALRLNEVITYYKNMSAMTVPLRVLQNNITVRPEDVGEKNWHTMECLETSVDLKNNTIIISCEIISKNGFRIEVTDGVNGKQFNITDMPAHISYYGIEDLKEILDLIDKHGFTSNLIEYRPLKIASYIRSETIKNCLASPFNFENQGRDSMFTFWIKNVRHVYPNCLHHMPVSLEIHKFI